MSTRIIIAAAAVTVLVVPAPGSAQTPPKVYPHAEHSQATAPSGAYAAANKSSRAKRLAQRGRVAQPTDASIYRVTTPDGRLAGADPDATIRFELRRDPNLCQY